MANRLPRFALVALAAIGLMAAGAATAPPASAWGVYTDNFFFTGAPQAWNVPTGVQSVALTITGGSGGSGADGTFTYASTNIATLAIPSGVSGLDVIVGGSGGNSSNGAGVTSVPGGWPNGGSSATNDFWTGGGGGGSSDIRPKGAPFSSALIVAGGAGGNGGYSVPEWGGLGGWGAVNGAGAGQAGQGDDGGAGGGPGFVGSPSQGGNGAAGNTNSGSGGGGGGGWWGGAAGSPGTAWSVSLRHGGGGGGGGGMGMANSQYVSSLNSYSGQQSAGVQIQYLGVLKPSIPTLSVGTFASWIYEADANATYAVTSGALPAGLTLDGNTGYVQGVPTQVGTSSFTVTATLWVGSPGQQIQMSTSVPSTVTVKPGAPATLVATSATGIGTTSATMNGAVTPGGSPVTTLTCAYSTKNPGSGAITGRRVAAFPTSVAPSSTPGATAVICPVSGLLSNQTYYFQVQGVQGSASVRSGTASFTTGSTLAWPTTAPATGVGLTAATGRGSVTSNQAVSAIFCRAATNLVGVITGSGSPKPFTVPASPASSRGRVTNLPVRCAFTGLKPGRVYYYAVLARDASGTAIAPQVQAFVTLASPPRVGPIAASRVTTTTATITGSVTPTSEAVRSIRCKYVTNPGNPKQGTAVAATPSRASAAPITRAASCALTGLQPATTYLVRMEATDSDGTGASGNTLKVTTPAAGTSGAQGGGSGSGAAGGPTVKIVSAGVVTDKRIAMRVRVNQPGTVRVVGSYAPGPQAATARATTVACSASRAVPVASIVNMSCPLAAPARARLRLHALRVSLRARFTTTGAGSATATRSILVPRFPPRVPPVTG